MTNCRKPHWPARRTSDRTVKLMRSSLLAFPIFLFLSPTSGSGAAISRRDGEAACAFNVATIACSDYTLRRVGTSEAAPLPIRGQRFADAKGAESRLFVTNSVAAKQGQNLMESCLEECSAYAANECAGVYLWRLGSGSVKCIGLKATKTYEQYITSTSDDYSFTRQSTTPFSNGGNMSANNVTEVSTAGGNNSARSSIAAATTTTATSTSSTATSSSITTTTPPTTTSTTTTTAPATTSVTTTGTTTTPCLRVNLRPSCEQYLEMGHCSPSSVLYDYMATSCLGTCVDIPCPGAPTTAPSTSTRTMASTTMAVSATPPSPPSPPPGKIDRTAPLSSTFSSTSSTSTAAPSTARNATEEAAASSGVVSSTVRVAAPSAGTVPPAVITITSWNSDSNANGGGNGGNGDDDALYSMSAKESASIILIALGASILSTACGVACVLYRYESPAAKRKLTAQLAATLAAAKVNGDAAIAVDTVLATATPEGSNGASRPELLGLLQSVAGVNAVIREAARRGVVGDIPPGYTTDSVSTVGRWPSERGGRGNHLRLYHSDAGVAYPGAYPRNSPQGRRGSEILNSYLLARAQSEPNPAPRGRGRIPTARRNDRSKGSREAMEILRQFPVVPSVGDSREARAGSLGSTSGRGRFEIPAFGDSVAFSGGGGANGNPRRAGGGANDGDGGNSNGRRNGFAVPRQGPLRPQPQPASTAVAGARSRAAVFAQVPRGEAGAVVPQFPDVDGYFNAYGMVSGRSPTSQSDFTDDDDLDQHYTNGGGVNSDDGSASRSDGTDGDDDAYENEAGAASNGASEVMSTVTFPIIDPASAIERAFAIEAGVEYNAGEYHNHGADFALGMMDDYFANGGDGFIDDDEFDVVASNATPSGYTGSVAESATAGASTIYDDSYLQQLAITVGDEMSTIISEASEEDAARGRSRDRSESQVGSARTYSVSGSQGLLRSGSPLYTFVDKNNKHRSRPRLPARTPLTGSSGYTSIGGEKGPVNPDALIWDDSTAPTEI